MEDKKNILHRYFTNKYSKSDFDEVQGMFQHPATNDLKDKLEEHWMDFEEDENDSVDLSNVSSNLKRWIHAEKSIRPVNRMLQRFQKIAAILILPLVLAFTAYVFFHNKTAADSAYAEIQCPMGVRTKFVLPDGTTGFLQNGSKLKYPINFRKRKVELVGEAFFDVEHDNGRLFSVLTDGLKINVLGTRFNVVAYPDDDFEEVVLEEGKVQVNSVTGQLLGTLSPNQMLKMNREAENFSIDQVEAFQYVSWTDGKLVMRNEKFENAVKRLSRWYNADIEVEEGVLTRYSFRATFKDESLEEVLELMKLTAPFKFEIEKRVLNDKNEYEKKKVKITLDRERLRDF